jgi:hypothetical protein
MSLLTSVRSLRRTPYLKDTVKGRQRVCSVGYWLGLNSFSYEAVIPKRGVLQPREGIWRASGVPSTRRPYFCQAKVASLRQLTLLASRTEELECRHSCLEQRSLPGTGLFAGKPFRTDLLDKSAVRRVPCSRNCGCSQTRCEPAEGNSCGTLRKRTRSWCGCRAWPELRAFCANSGGRLIV